MTPHLPQPSPEDLLAAVREAQTEAHRLGVTGIHNVEGPDALAAFRDLEAENSLRLRVLFHPPVQKLPDLLRMKVTSGSGTEWLRLGGVKMFLDGSLGSRTAWMLEPYEDSRDRGMPITAEEVAREAMTTAARAGLACTVHAIGDAAVRRALDLMSCLPQAAIPHRIEHFQCVSPADLDRAAAAGIVVSMQPAHLLVDIPLADRQWGARSRGAYAFKSLLQRGTVVAFGSDVPVATLDPRQGVYAAMERRMLDGAPMPGWYPEERLSFEEVVSAYTQANARAAGVADRRGTLGIGMDADLVAWQADPVLDRGNGEAFLKGCAALTVVGGEVMMQA
jgi:predicted amidohydrolase YtcJ